MTMLIIEQGATIESQRALIRELFRDSAELSAMKMKAQQDTTVADRQRHAQTPSSKTQAQLTQNPSSQNPSTQAPTNQTPSSQAVPQRRTQNEKQKPQFQMPSKAPAELIDDRRALITI